MNQVKPKVRYEMRLIFNSKEEFAIMQGLVAQHRGKLSQQKFLRLALVEYLQGKGQISKNVLAEVDLKRSALTIEAEVRLLLYLALAQGKLTLADVERLDLTSERFRVLHNVVAAIADSADVQWKGGEGDGTKK